MNCDNCNKELNLDDFNFVYINMSPYSFIAKKRPYGSYTFCDDCLGVTKKLKEVRQVTDPPIQEPLGMFAKIKEFFSEKQSGDKLLLKENAMNLKEQLLTILVKKYDWDDTHVKIKKIDKGLQITYGCQYTSPELSFAKLVELSELFGTKEIDVDNYSQSGCESCDYGSDYGHDIQIYNPTKNVKEATELFEIDLYKKESK